MPLVLLRHDISAGALRFVDARLLDLGGWGVRALDHDGGRVYGLSPAGPDDAQDVEQAAFRLWWFPAERLNGPDPIAVLPLADVPPRSEGVAIHAGHAIVVQDGDEGSPNCDEDSSYTLIPLR